MYSLNSVRSHVVLSTCVYILEVVHHSDTGIDGLYEASLQGIQAIRRRVTPTRSEVIVIFVSNLQFEKLHDITYSLNSVRSHVVLGTCVYVLEVVHHSDIGIDGLYKHHYKGIKPFGAV